ncbi:hypothetical protein [Parachryseolinea silvisoli]|uniref:hypothetical protein n=1 Tax=Parachryseolinea silvisoli TaxID=2873601 RepID=UPI002265FA1A|nr:hypothetical protein [Parachryseolinea silvisoli]MCD9015355.1 hypothetical protein [Parachryseolinea silvisoli]
MRATSIFLFLVYVLLMMAVGFAYWWQRKETMRTREVAAFLSSLAEDAMDVKKERVQRYRYQIENCQSFFERTQHAEMREAYQYAKQLLAVLDSGVAILDRMSKEHEDRALCEHLFQDYRQLIQVNRSILRDQSSQFKFLLFPYVGLDTALLPERMDVKERDAVEISVVILEDGLYHVVQWNLYQALSDPWGAERCPDY